MTAAGLYGNLMDDPIFRYRTVANGATVSASLPGLFTALAADEVRDFPALRAHQRHPWHALLVQLAALAMHQAGLDELPSTVHTWRQALLGLTPDAPDGAAWCLVAPPDRPAFLQAPVPEGHIDGWKNVLDAADALDMLVTSKNHDLKAARMLAATAEDWCYALVSLQTQEGFLGAGNYGISRMNGGFASRCGVGILPSGGWGRRWRRDIAALWRHRGQVCQQYGLRADNGIALTWLLPWDGQSSLEFSRLDPWYVEVCRRIRLGYRDNRWSARATGTKAPRIAAKELNGATGDPWMPVETAAAKALTVSSKGFDYKLATELLFGGKYQKPAAQILQTDDGEEGIALLVQGVTRGQGKTEGYHERRIPISPRMRRGLLTVHTDGMARMASERIAAIGSTRNVLWSALVTLFMNAAKDDTAKDRDASDTVKERASRYARPFEVTEDARFFTDLIDEIEADAAAAVREEWLRGLARRAQAVLVSAFEAGPRSGALRYRARAAANGKFHGLLRSDKVFAAMAHALRQRPDANSTARIADDSA